MRRLLPWIAALALASCGEHAPEAGTPKAAQSDPAKSTAAFAGIAKVLLHPRCANCHPTDDQPRQGDASAVHDPPVWRGASGFGVPGVGCDACHQPSNSAAAGVPGAPGWRLPPKSMGWLGKSPAALCAQLKDPKRNGGRSLDALHQHMANDHLVAWGWHPGDGRAPAPGTQAQLGALVRTWIDTGAHCPEEAP